MPPSVPLFLSNNWECTNDFQLVKSSEPKTESRFKTVPQTLNLINSIEKPIAVFSICGPHRTGKSYFASKILGVPNTFTVSNCTESCTHGIWMATTVLECDDYVLLVLDMEGTQDPRKDKTKPSVMSSFLVMTTLISSYLVYNSMNKANQSDIVEME